MLQRGGSRAAGKVAQDQKGALARLRKFHTQEHQSGQRPDAAPGPSSVAEAAKESPGQPTPPSAKKDGEDVWFEVGKDLGLAERCAS